VTGWGAGGAIEAGDRENRTAERLRILGDERWLVGEADRSGPQFGAWPTLASHPDIVYTLRDWPGSRNGLPPITRRCSSSSTETLTSGH
jgi:hypothetical protein